MTLEAFESWQNTQDKWFEFVDGVPLGMVGARRNHDRIVMNAARDLGTQLRGRACQPFSEAVGVRIPGGNIRRPDLGVDCGLFDPQATSTATPSLVIEVLPPSTRGFDQARKLEEYKTIESLQYILLVDTEAPEVLLWQRAPGRSWQFSAVAGLDAVIVFPALDAALPLSALYEGLTFRAPPHLVQDEP